MNLDEVMEAAIQPALAMLPVKMSTDEARLMMLAIGLQESRFQYRRQIGNGPARGFWQFEQGGSVKGVMTHPATKDHAAAICAAQGVEFDRAKVWAALEFDDVLAAAFARLNLWWAHGPLPSVDDVDGAWHLYADVTWRPGKPHRETWDGFHQQAQEALGL